MPLSDFDRLSDQIVAFLVNEEVAGRGSTRYAAICEETAPTGCRVFHSVEHDARVSMALLALCFKDNLVEARVRRVPIPPGGLGQQGTAYQATVVAANADAITEAALDIGEAEAAEFKELMS